MDMLIGNGLVESKVFGQIGESTYLPVNFLFTKYMAENDFKKQQEISDIIITHGGTGTIVTSLKLKKKVIVVPRLFEYKEHIDNHQLEVATALEKEGYLLMVTNISDLLMNINYVLHGYTLKPYSNKSDINKLISEFLDKHI